MNSNEPNTDPSLTQQASNNRLVHSVNDENIQMIEESEDDQDPTQNENEIESGGKKRKQQEPRSKYWKYYKEEHVYEGDPPVRKRKGKCLTCGTLIAAHSKRNGTTGLKQHLASCRKKNAEKSGQTLLSYQPSADGDGTGSLTTWKFDQKAIRMALCEMIIIDELPFRFIEREGFRKFMAKVCPQFIIPCRKTIRDDCARLFIEQKAKLSAFFSKKGIGRVSITTDCWTAINNTSYICVTAHCIGKDWSLYKKIISFRKIGSHKGKDIGESVVTTLNDWNLKSVMCCTVDNACANDGAVQRISSELNDLGTSILGGKYLQLRCVAHVINLIVSDGLEEVGMSVKRVREAVKYIKSSPARSEQFNNCVQALKINCKKSLCLDVATRWNSTYLMLEAAEPFEGAFMMYGGMNSSYVAELTKKADGPPTIDDWVNVKKIMEYLKRFYDLTLLVSGTSYVTSHLFFKEMCDVFDIISELELNEDFEISLMAQKMMQKVGKYWSEEFELNPKMNRILYIAALLDPRQKMKHVEKCLKKVYGANRATQLVRELRESMDELFEFYKKQLAPCPTLKASCSRSSVAINPERRSNRRGSCSTLLQDSSDEEGDDIDTSEMTIYFTEKQFKEQRTGDEANAVDTFDVLKWWSTHGMRFPVLSEMARDILAIPISTVASESAFSAGGRIMNEFRSSLNHEMIEALVCVEDWLRSSKSNNEDAEDVPEEELAKEFQAVLSLIERERMGATESTTRN